MKKILLGILAFTTAHGVMAQLKTYDLYVVAEGNFGTANGDVFRASRTSDTSHNFSGALFQTANNTVGIDVLQDYGTFGNKAVLCGKGGSSSKYKLSIVEYPSFDTIQTFQSIAGIQCLGKASNTKGYLGMANGGVQLLNLTNNTITPVTDAGNLLSSYASYMVQANGFMYVAIGSKIVKIDTATNVATTSFVPGIGSIAGMQYDATNNCIWLLGKVSGTSVLVKLDPGNSDFLNTPIVLTGITNATQLRLAVNKLYFLSARNVHAYNIAIPNIPTPVLYISVLSGSSFSFAYGKSFDVDPNTGDFAIASAGNFSQPSMYEIIDGTTLQLIDTGSVAGKIANELELHTYIKPVPAATTLPDVYAQCDTTLNVPTALAGNVIVHGTATDSTYYNTQGSYNVTWTFTNGYVSATQTQHVVIDDTTAPVPNIAALPSLSKTCPYTLESPTALDNCKGNVTGTTDSTTFTTGGTYDIHWHYADGNGNTTVQTQHIQISCTTGIHDIASGQNSIKVYPNPAQHQVNIDFTGYNSVKTYQIVIKNALGQSVLNQTSKSAQNVIDIAALPAGLYFVSILQDGNVSEKTEKLLIR